MPPRRDAFALSLSALRRRLREGEDAPGDALPIQLIAEDLRLSTTPVREALSRLAGEDLVEKRGPAYTRPHLDGPTLAQLYNLRLIYLSAALAPDVERRAARRRLPAHAPLDLAGQLAQGAAPAELIEALFLEIMLSGDDLILAQVYQRAAARLAPFLAAEAEILADVGPEALALVAAFETRDAAGLRLDVRRYHRRRVSAAHAISRLADGGKYRPVII